jgi:hypothetical protein
MTTATITYNLSAAGQKAAILAGLPANRNQMATIEVEVPADALDLFNISAGGALSYDFAAGWDSDMEQDEVLTSANAVQAIRAHIAFKAEKVERRRIEDEQRKEQRRLESADLRAQAIEMLQADPNQSYGVTVDSGTITVVLPLRGHAVLGSDDSDPQVAALVQQIVAAREVAARKAENEKLLPSVPACEACALQPGGGYKFDVPGYSSKWEAPWAKHVASVDVAQANGTAFNGSWMDVGKSYVQPAGELIVTGAKRNTGSRKRPSWDKIRTLYVVTPAGLLRADGNDAPTAAAFLAQTVEERLRAVYVTRIDLATKCVQAATALISEHPEIAAEGHDRGALWIAEGERITAALADLDRPAPIGTLEEAAEAIISAGFKALALANHPDKGGSAATMALLTDARNSLRQILQAATAVQS